MGNGEKWWEMVKHGGKWWNIVQTGGKLWKIVGIGGKRYKMYARRSFLFCVLDIACVYVFYVGLCVQCVLCGFNKATSRC